MILVDTSVWVDHLRRGDEVLASLLNKGVVLCHPFVVGELACGNIRQRDEILSLLSALPSAPLAGHEEAIRLVSQRLLMSRGIGWVDVHLLASSLLSHSKLWTKDKALEAVATALKIEYAGH